MLYYIYQGSNLNIGICTNGQQVHPVLGDLMVYTSVTTLDMGDIPSLGTLPVQCGNALHQIVHSEIAKHDIHNN